MHLYSLLLKKSKRIFENTFYVKLFILSRYSLRDTRDKIISVCKNFTFSSLLMIYFTISRRESLKLYVSDIFETVAKFVLGIVDIFV